MTLDGLALLPRTLMDEALAAARASTPDLVAAEGKADAAGHLVKDVSDVLGIPELYWVSDDTRRAVDAFRGGQAELGALHLEDGIRRFDVIAGVLAMRP